MENSLTEDEQRRAHAEMAYLRSAEHIIETDYALSKASKFMETYWSAQDHFEDERQFLQSMGTSEDPVLTGAAREATIALEVLDQAMSLIVEDLMSKIHQQKPLTATGGREHGLSEGEQNDHNSQSLVHVKLTSGFLDGGQLQRESGDTLCEKAGALPELASVSQTPSCRACIRHLMQQVLSD